MGDKKAELLKDEVVEIVGLKPHPENYRDHPDDQLAHVVESIGANGVYRNVVVSKDDYILAGHGVVLALGKMGEAKVTVKRVPFLHTDPRALKVLVGDNEIGHLGMPDDRKLTEILKHVMESDTLLGTGFDEQQVAALAFVTRPASEVGTIEESKEWLGMPSFEPAVDHFKVIVLLATEAERDKFLAHLGAKVLANKEGRTCSLWWPVRDEKRDVSSVKFKAGANGKTNGKPKEARK